jgi:hypothetical protein
MLDPDLPPIHTIRSQRVVLDCDLAVLYGVSTKRLNEAVKRNIHRFPSDFRFQLTREENGGLVAQARVPDTQLAEQPALAPNRSRFATGSSRHRDPRFLPFAFTELGALMAATVLNSTQAVQMSLYVVRAFVRMRGDRSHGSFLHAARASLGAFQLPVPISTCDRPFFGPRMDHA